MSTGNLIVGNVKKKFKKLPLRTTAMMENLRMRATQLGMDAVSRAVNVRRS